MAIKRKLRTCLTDVDDTQICWEVAHAEAYPAMSRTLSEAAGLPHDEIVAQMRKIYTDHGTIEYTALVQAMPAFAHLSKNKKRDLIKQVVSTHRDALKGLAVPFPGVKELIRKVKNRTRKKPIAHVAFSDAPKNLAYRRLHTAGYTRGLIDAIIALDSPPDELFDPEYQMEARGYKVPVLVAQKRKPHTDLEKILGLTAEQISETCYMMGNSLHSDGGIAQVYGMRFYHTKWDKGTAAHRAILKEYAPETVLAANVGTEAETSLIVHPNFEYIPVNHPMEIYEDLIGNNLI